jgi:hypothetical protein
VHALPVSPIGTPRHVARRIADQIVADCIFHRRRPVRPSDDDRPPSNRRCT